MNTIDEVKQESKIIQEDIILCKSEIQMFDEEEEKLINKITNAINELKFWDNILTNNAQIYNHIIVGLLNNQ